MVCCATNKVHLPANITAGLSFRAVVSCADNPAPDWSATLYLRGPKTINLTATPDGATHVFEADAADTTAWPAGLYWFSVRVAKGGDVQEVGAGELTVLADLTTATDGYDGRSPNEISLAAIQAVLAKRATQDQQRYMINNRELWRMTIGDLLKLLAFYRNAVKRERNKKSGRSTFGRAIPVRFSNK